MTIEIEINEVGIAFSELDADGNPILSDPDSPDAQAAISSPLTLILAQN